MYSSACSLSASSTMRPSRVSIAQPMRLGGYPRSTRLFEDLGRCRRRRCCGQARAGALTARRARHAAPELVDVVELTTGQLGCRVEMDWASALTGACLMAATAVVATTPALNAVATSAFHHHPRLVGTLPTVRARPRLYARLRLKGPGRTSPLPALVHLVTFFVPVRRIFFMGRLGGVLTAIV